MKFQNAILSTIGLTVSASMAMAQANPPAPPQDPNKTFTITTKYVAGDLLKYKMKMNMNMEMKGKDGTSPIPAMDMVTSMVMRMTTLKANPDGSALIESKVTDGETSVMGQTQAIPATPATQMEVSKDGVVKLKNAANVPGMQALQGMMNMNNMPTMGVIMPDHPVKIGESWSKELDGIIGDKKMKITQTLISVEVVDGKDLMKIKQILEMPLDIMMGDQGSPVKDAAKAMMTMSGLMNSTGILSVYPDNGRFIKSDSDMSMTMVMSMKGAAAAQSPFGDSMNMTMKGKMVMDLISAGKAPAEPVKKAIVTTPLKKKTTKP
ncbi:MAG: hypothetical protein ABJA67_03975 [Chthonomonadales bacterium]